MKWSISLKNKSSLLFFLENVAGYSISCYTWGPYPWLADCVGQAQLFMTVVDQFVDNLIGGSPMNHSTFGAN